LASKKIGTCVSGLVGGAEEEDDDAGSVGISSVRSSGIESLGFSVGLDRLGGALSSSGVAGRV
jgi:hypothetical protein